MAEKSILGGPGGFVRGALAGAGLGAVNQWVDDVTKGDQPDNDTATQQPTSEAPSEPDNPTEEAQPDQPTTQEPDEPEDVKPVEGSDTKKKEV